MTNKMIVEGNDINKFTGNGQNVPKPPKKGEIMICQICGKPILPDQFSTNENERKREFKWHIHSACYQFIDEFIDRSVPGLISERKEIK